MILLMVNPGSATMPMSFGIGCYSFEAPSADHLLMQNSEGTYSVHDWADDVERALKSIPSLDKIRVEGFRSVRGDHAPTWRNTVEQVVKELPHDSRHRGGDLLPHPVNGRISFVATIPKHTQAQVFPYVAPMDGTVFEIDIRYAYGMPVAFVRCVTSNPGPSMAVALVREFLTSEFEQRTDSMGGIRFTCMGPSPMWADFFVKRSTVAAASPISVEIEDPPGYQSVEFTVGGVPEAATDDKAYALVKSALVEQASLYYDLVSRRNLLSLHRSYIEHTLQDLVEENRSTGFKAWLRRLFGGGRTANNLLLEILAVESEATRSLGGAAQEWDGIRSKGLVNPFEKLMKKELLFDVRDYTGNSQSVVTLLNERHSRDVQLVSLVITSLFGGIVGAAITALVQLGSVVGTATGTAP